MLHLRRHNFFILLYTVGFFIAGLSFSHGNKVDSKVLNVGEELLKETLPLQLGSCLYQLKGLKSYIWYEVKISYPASIPASFSLQLKRGKFMLELNQNRRLLNTEKLIFKTHNLDTLNDQGGLYILVTVEPEGIVAIPHISERQFITFNIVCDELLLGIPHKAWWLLVMVLLCLAVAFIVPHFISSCLLLKNHSSSQNGHKKS